MNLQEDIRPVTYLKNRAADLLKQVNETHRPVVITQNGVARAVLQDPQSYERLQRSIAMLKLLAQGEAAAEKGDVADQDTVFSTIKAALKKRKAAARVE